MTLLAPHDFLDITEALGLLTACPWTQSNPEDCRLHELRKEPLSELYTMLREASPADRAAVADACRDCPHRCSMGSRWS